MASSRLASSTSTVGAMSGDLADHLRVVRRQEVDDPRRPERDLRHRLGRADRQRAEEVLRGTHAGRLRNAARAPATHPSTCMPVGTLVRPCSRARSAARLAAWRRPPSGFAPLWVYFFGWFALAVAQRWLFPPDEHSTAANVAFFAVGAVARGRRPHDRRAPPPAADPRVSDAAPARTRRTDSTGGSGEVEQVAGADDEAVGDEAGDDAGVERRRPAGGRRGGPAARRRGPGGRCPRTAPGGC